MSDASTLTHTRTWNCDVCLRKLFCSDLASSGAWLFKSGQLRGRTCCRYVQVINLDILPTQEQLRWQWSLEWAKWPLPPAPWLVVTAMLVDADCYTCVVLIFTNAVLLN